MTKMALKLIKGSFMTNIVTLEKKIKNINITIHIKQFSTENPSEFLENEGNL